MSNPVSILLPVRNAETTLEECLRSIAAQSLRDFELLIVDDHSNDRSRQIATDYCSAHRRWRVIGNRGRGLVAALNHGIAATRSELIARMDADDLMSPQRLARQADHMTTNSYITVLGSCVSKFPEITDGYREYLTWQNQCCSAADIDSEIFVESPFAHPSVMFRRQRIIDAGGYRHGDFPEDYELWLRLHGCGLHLEKLPDVLLQWRDSPQRLSRSNSRYRREAFDELRAVYLSRDPRLTGHADDFVIWGAGRRTRQRCARLLDKGFRPQAWIDIDPRKIGNHLDGVPVVAPDWLKDRQVFVLVYVNNHGARADIAGSLHAMGYRRGRDYLMVG